jgi:predicted patatin/cPLA2 family phospholipase
MENTHTIQNNLSYLQSRFDSERININWRDKKAFGSLIDYIEELESEDIDYKMYLKRLTTYMLVQHLELILEERPLSIMDIKRSITKLEAVYRVDHRDWQLSFASRCWPLNTNSNYEDYKELINTLVSDVIRYNTKQNDISTI